MAEGQEDKQSILSNVAGSQRFEVGNVTVQILLFLRFDRLRCAFFFFDKKILSKFFQKLQMKILFDEIFKKSDFYCIRFRTLGNFWHQILNLANFDVGVGNSFQNTKFGQF